MMFLPECVRPISTMPSGASDRTRTMPWPVPLLVIPTPLGTARLAPS